MSNISSDRELRNFIAEEIGKGHYGESVLSIGVGAGVLERQLTEKWGLNVTGIDLVKRSLKKAERKGITTVLADGENLPFSDKSFDIIVFPESIGHMNIDNALKEAHRVLKPGGVIHIITHASDTELWGGFNYRPDSRYGITVALKRNGFGEGLNILMGMPLYTYIKSIKPSGEQLNNLGSMQQVRTNI